MNLFFDLDGTLLDSKPRLYKLFQNLVPQSQLSYDEYWMLKQNKINHKQILCSNFQYSFEKYEKFERLWMKKIEEIDWLEIDKPFDGIIEYLKDLYQNHRVLIVTARQFEDLVIQQIKKLGLYSFVHEVLVTSQKVDKFDIIINNVNVSPNAWFIGDTGKDIKTVKALGIRTAGVLTGFLNRSSLESYEPDIIVEKVTDLTFN